LTKKNEAGNWVGFQGGGALVGVAGEDLGTPPLKLRWSRKLNEEERAAVGNSAAIFGEVVYVADLKGGLRALSIQDGATRWTYTAETKGEGEGDAAAFETAPLVVQGEKGVRVFLGDMQGRFHCVDGVSGEKVWTFQAAGPERAERGIHSSANFFKDGTGRGRVVFGMDSKEIYSLDAEHGKLVWKGQAEDRVNAAVTVWEGKLLVTGCDARLRVLSAADGKETGIFDLKMLTGGGTAATREAWVVGTDQGRVLNIDPQTLTSRWIYTGIEDAAMVYGTPAVSEGMVIVGAKDRCVHAIDLATGKARWVFRTGGEIVASPVVSGGYVYVGSADKNLYALNVRTGELAWSYAGTRKIDAPVAIGGGVLIVGDTGGTVYCFERR